MVVQVSTRIDKATKKQFDKVCEAIGVSPSNALSMLIKGVINYNGIPFDVAALPANTPTKMSPMAMHEPAVAYGTAKSKLSRDEAFGCMRGQYKMSDDFDAPLDDFKEYMTSALAKLNDPSQKKMPLKDVFGCMRGQFEMSDDFDAPLEDFKEYM